MRAAPAGGDRVAARRGCRRVRRSVISQPHGRRGSARARRRSAAGSGACGASRASSRRRRRSARCAGTGPRAGGRGGGLGDVGHQQAAVGAPEHAACRRSTKPSNSSVGTPNARTRPSGSSTRRRPTRSNTMMFARERQRSSNAGVAAGHQPGAAAERDLEDAVAVGPASARTRPSGRSASCWIGSGRSVTPRRTPVRHSAHDEPPADRVLVLTWPALGVGHEVRPRRPRSRGSCRTSCGSGSRTTTAWLIERAAELAREQALAVELMLVRQHEAVVEVASSGAAVAHGPTGGPDDDLGGGDVARRRSRA